MRADSVRRTAWSPLWISFAVGRVVLATNGVAVLQEMPRPHQGGVEELDSRISRVAFVQGNAQCLMLAQIRYF